MKNHGWKFVVNIPDVKKCVICVAPHTIKYLLRALGGIPVSRGRSTNVTGDVIDTFNRRDSLAVAVTPEGTRSRNPHWHKGFLYIAKDAGVPIVLGYFNYDKKIVCLDRIFEPSDDVDADMLAIKRYYDSVDCKGKYPEKFTTGL